MPTIFEILNWNFQSIDDVYYSAKYGAIHKEARLIKLLTKFGSKFAKQRLTKNDLKEAIKEIEAIDSLKKGKGHQIDLSSKEVKLISTVLRVKLKSIKNIPTLSREQAIISITVIFESFISDLINLMFDENINTLKSDKATLKDEELIESLNKGNTFEILKKKKIRNIMFGSVDDWIIYFHKVFKFNINTPYEIIELFLVRNCLIHNNKLVSRDLENKIKKKRYSYNKKINITENDYNRYLKAVKDFSYVIWKEYNIKF